VLEIVAGFAVEGPLGGVERFGIELARALDRTHVEPILCGLWRHGTPHEDEWLDRLRAEGIVAYLAADLDPVHPYRSFVNSIRGIEYSLAGQRVDLIHSHSEFGDVLALLIAPRLGARALLRTVHNEREWPKRPGRHLFLTHLLYPVCFRLEIGVSQQVVENLNRRWVARLLRRRGLCIHNAIDLARFRHLPNGSIRQQKRAELGIPAEAPLIGSVGRLTQQKGYSVLLGAMPEVLRENPLARLLLVGDGELAGKLRDLARDLDIAHAVHFAGPRSDIEALLVTMDLFVSSSLWEGLPTVILESMAARIPVVATDVSGTRELVQDGQTGLLIPPAEPLTLARAITQVLQNRDQMGTIVDQAHQRVQDFSIQRVAAKHVEMYIALSGSQ
jgi:glycosyltransferase involved in cell wall biosynthesis